MIFMEISSRKVTKRISVGSNDIIIMLFYPKLLLDVSKQINLFQLPCFKCVKFHIPCFGIYPFSVFQIIESFRFMRLNQLFIPFTETNIPGRVFRVIYLDILHIILQQFIHSAVFLFRENLHFISVSPQIFSQFCNPHGCNGMIWSKIITDQQYSLFHNFPR